MSKGFLSAESIVSAKKATSTPKCGGACKLNKSCLTSNMEPSGRGRDRVLFVGEAPGEKEDREGTQLIGESGQLLRAVLSGMGVDLDDCRKTNAVTCRPPDNRTPTPEEIIACRVFLIQEIEKFQPTVIIPLGGTAVESIISLDRGKDSRGISRWCGWNIPSRTWNAWICPTYHPAFLLHSNDRVLEVIFKEHLGRALSHDGRPYSDAIPDEKEEVRLLAPEEAPGWLEDCRQRGGAIAFDYETTGLKPDSEGHQIVCCSVCHSGHKTVAFMMTPEAVKPLKRLLRDGRVKKIASNLKFEHRWTKAILGVDVQGWWWDTMLAAHCLDNRPYITSVKFQAYVRLGTPEYDSHISPHLRAKSANGHNSVHSIDKESLLLYCGLDSLLEMRVAWDQMKEMGHPWRPKEEACQDNRKGTRRRSA